MAERKIRTLKDVLPREFIKGSYNETKAYQLKDEEVKEEHCRHYQQDEYISWPGSHKNVYFWVELMNGNAVGWNENPVRGWSFPVIKLKKD